MRLKKTPWGGEEVRTLKANFEKVTWEELLLLLPDRNKDSIRAQARRQNLTTQNEKIH